MSGFLYFLPGISRMATLPSAAVIAERGLSYAFEGRPHGRGCSGPNGQEGFILGCRRRFADGGEVYFDAAQQWQSHPNGKYLVGYFPDRLPGPTELAREKLLDGPWLELADDRRWQVPLARSVHDASEPGKFGYVWDCELPQRVALNAAGDWCEQGPLPRYQQLWDLVSGWNDYRRGVFTDPDNPGAVDQPLADHWSLYKTRIEAAVQVLAANYVLGPVECSILGLLTKENVKEVLDLAIDEPELKAILKKYLATIAQAQSIAAAAGSSSSAGPVAETNPITPPSQT